MYKLIALVFLLFTSLVGIALSLVNTDPVVFNYYIDEIKIPLSLLLVLTFILGFFICLLVSLPAFLKLKYYLAKHKSHSDKSVQNVLPLIKPDEH